MVGWGSVWPISRSDVCVLRNARLCTFAVCPAAPDCSSRDGLSSCLMGGASPIVHTKTKKRSCGYRGGSGSSAFGSRVLVVNRSSKLRRAKLVIQRVPRRRLCTFFSKLAPPTTQKSNIAQTLPTAGHNRHITTQSATQRNFIHTALSIPHVFGHLFGP